MSNYSKGKDTGLIQGFGLELENNHKIIMSFIGFEALSETTN
jgi:hypothetical protein